MMEFATTVQVADLAPVPPGGDGWMLGGSAAAYPGTVYHYWQRPKEHQAKVCSQCRAMAFVEGKCVGCGKHYVPTQ